MDTNEHQVFLNGCCLISCKFVLIRDLSSGSYPRNPRWSASPCRYRTSEPNSPLLTRVRIFIFGLTAAIVRMICPRSVIVML
jgi:hypothetical protein